MVNHLTGVEAGELVVAAARSGTFAILPVGCPACLADDRLAVNFPVGLHTEARVYRRPQRAESPCHVALS